MVIVMVARVIVSASVTEKVGLTFFDVTTWLVWAVRVSCVQCGSCACECSARWLAVL